MGNEPDCNCLGCVARRDWEADPRAEALIQAILPKILPLIEHTCATDGEGKSPIGLLAYLGMAIIQSAEETASIIKSLGNLDDDELQDFLKDMREELDED